MFGNHDTYSDLSLQVKQKNEDKWVFLQQRRQPNGAELFEAVLGAGWVLGAHTVPLMSLLCHLIFR